MLNDMPDSSFIDFVIDQLSGLRTVEARKMFGGYGLYSDGTIFAIAYDDQLFLKTTDTTAEQFHARGMEQFSPRPGQTLRQYFSVPDDVLEDRERLKAWSSEAITALPN